MEKLDKKNDERQSAYFDGICVDVFLFARRTVPFVSTIITAICSPHVQLWCNYGNPISEGHCWMTNHTCSFVSEPVYVCVCVYMRKTLTRPFSIGHLRERKNQQQHRTELQIDRCYTIKSWTVSNTSSFQFYAIALS